MKCNNITILIFSILILVNLINTEKTCKCENNKAETDDKPNDDEYERRIKNEITKDYNENVDENDDENDERNNTENDSENCSELENCKKKKRKAGLYKNRRRQKQVLDMIPFYRIPAIIFNAFKKSISFDRETREIKDFEISNFAKELSKAIRKRHLSGFVGGLGLHAADFADHLVDISKDVIGEHQRAVRSNDEFNVFGKLSDRIRLRSAGLLSIQKDDMQPEDIELPFENLGSTVRNLVDLLPSEDSKYYYYKHYKPVANEIKKKLNSTKVRSLLKNAFTSDIFSINRDPKRRSTKVRFQRFKPQE